MTVDKGRLWAFVENKDGEIKLIKLGYEKATAPLKVTRFTIC